MAAVLPPRSDRTVGAAIVMTVLSSRSMISATSTMARTTQRQRYAGGGCAAADGTGAARAAADMRDESCGSRGPSNERRSLRTVYVTNDVRVNYTVGPWHGPRLRAADGSGRPSRH